MASDDDPLIRRAVLPEYLLVPDISLVTGTKDAATRKNIIRGVFGPYMRLGRRLAVRRDSLVAALAAREVVPEAAASTPPVPKPKPEYLKLLRRHRRKGAR